MKCRKYVFFSSNFLCYRDSYKDIIELENVTYIDTIEGDNSFVLFLYKVYIHLLCNNGKMLLFKKLWFSHLMHRTHLKKDDNVVFIFTRQWLEFINNGFIEFLKSNYINSKYVFYYQDLINNDTDLVPTKIIKQKMDLVLSFDWEESKKFDILHYGLPYSKVNYENFSKESDVFFLGAAKNRLDEIYEVFEYLYGHGIKCKFIIVGAPAEKKRFTDLIEYRDFVPYLEYIEHLKRTGCILEIMQKNGTGYTMRMGEAIAYHKRILSNNSYLLKEKFYDPEKIIAFSNIETIDCEVLKRNDNVIYQNENSISPLEFLQFIDMRLSE